MAHGFMRGCGVGPYHGGVSLQACTFHWMVCVCVSCSQRSSFPVLQETCTLALLHLHPACGAVVPADAQPMTVCDSFVTFSSFPIGSV